MADKLDIFLSLLKEKNKKDVIEQMLLSSSNDVEAFLYLYESQPESLRPDWKNEYSKYFRDTFFSVISSLPDEKFNYYFFQGFHELMDIQSIRNVCATKQDNVELQNFIRKIDNPTSIDKLIDALKNMYFNDQNRYLELFDKNKEQLKKLNTIIAPKSRALDHLYLWLESIFEEEGLIKVIELCDKINYDLIERSIKTKRKIRCNRFDLRCTNNDIVAFETLFNRQKTKNKYKVLCSFTDLKDIVSTMKKAIEKDKVFAMYLWSIYEPYILSLREDHGIGEMLFKNYKNLHTMIKDGDVFHVLEALLIDENGKKQIGFNSYINNETVKYFVDNFKTLILNIKLEVELSVNNHMTKKIKL